MNDFSVVRPVPGHNFCVVSCCKTVRVAPFLSIHPVISINHSPIKNIKFNRAIIIVLAICSAFISPAYATITQRGTATSATTTSTTLTISKPAGVIAGDVMIVNITQTGNTGTNASLTGWTLIAGAQQSSGAPRRSTILYRVADGTEGTSFSFTLGSGTTSAVGSVIAFSGVDASVVFDVAPGLMNTGGGTTITATGITTVSANAAIVFLGGAGGTDEDTYSNWSGSTPTFSEIMDYSYSTGSNYNSVGTAWGILTTPGATGDKTVSVDGNYYWAGILIALRPQLYYTYTVPAGVYSLQVEVWGGGGRGGSRTSSGVCGGGGGGAYSRSVMAVTPGQVIPYSLGLGSSTTAAGGDAWFSSPSTLMAKGGNSVADNSATGAVGGAASSGVGQVRYSGGDGASGVTGSYGGGGGSSAGTAANGNAGSGSAGGTAPAGGGNGGNGATSNGNAGTAGSAPGGGGGGARRGNNGGTVNGGAGANGQIIITPQTTPFWLKADAGTSTTADGAGVTSWNDQSGSANNGISPSAAGTGYTASTTNPAYASVLWNYNPGINFTNGYFRLNRGGIQDDITFFTVYNSTQTSSSTSWWLSPAIIGAEADGTNNDFGLGHNAGILFFKGINTDPLTGFVQTSTNQNTGAPKIVTATRKKGASATNYLYVNGTQNGSKTSDNNSLSDPAYIGIGRNPTQAGSQFTGGISEAIGKSYLVTTTERYAVETYLAVKYGITLPYDYKRIHATDSIIYPVAGYGYDIAGLGRNSFYALNQKVSSSVNVASGSSRVVMATTNDFASSNLNASRAALTDGQYLLWGHNNATTNSWNSISGKYYKKVSRVWQVRNTGNVGPVYFQIDLSSYPALPSAHFYALLVSTNSSFTGTTTYYKLTKGSGNLYSTQPVFASGSSYFTIAAIPNYWIGTQSTVWSNPANWSVGVPATGEDVEFATIANIGTPAVNDLIMDADYTIGNLVNATNYKLVIPTTRTLTVNGTVNTNNANRILIRSAANTANGSLIFAQPTLNTSVLASVEMYSRAYKGDPLTFIDPVTGLTYTVSYKWQYFGSPVKDAVYSSTFTADPISFVRVSDETKNGNTTYYDEWTQLYNEDKLVPFKGYEITQNTDQSTGKLITFTGALVTASQTLTLTNTPKGTAVDTGSGSNIFGNSFTAAIDINKIVFPSSGVEKTVYLYNTGNLKEWSDYYDDAEGQLVAPGSYYAVPQNTSPVIQREIPSMQGFMLTATTNNSTVTIPYSSVLNNTLPQRAPSLGGGKFSYLTVDVLSKTAADRVWLFSHPFTSHRYDNGWDGRKISGTEGLSLFVDENYDQLQVSTTENLDSTFISLMAGKDTEYTLRINKKYLTDYETLYLTDLVTKTVTDLSGLDEISYTFTAANTTKAERRFLITSKDSKPNNELKPKQFDIFSRGNTVLIKNPSDASGVVRIFDMIGQLRHTTALKGNSLTEIKTALAPAIYIVRVTATGIDQSEKIIIHH